MYQSSPSQDSDLEQNYNHYSQSHNKLSSGRHFSAAALNANEEQRGGVEWWKGRGRLRGEAGPGEGRGNGLELAPMLGRLQLRAVQRAVQRGSQGELINVKKKKKKEL